MLSDLRASVGDEVPIAADMCPDVMLIDVRMPEMDGVEATRRIVVSDLIRRRRVGTRESALVSCSP